MYACRNSSWAVPALSRMGTTLPPPSEVDAPVNTSFKSFFDTSLALTLGLAITVTWALAWAVKIDADAKSNNAYSNFLISVSPFVRGLEAYANLQHGEASGGLDAARVEIGVVVFFRSVDKMLLHLGIKKLVEVIAPGNDPVFGIAGRSQRGGPAVLLAVVCASGELLRQLVASHRIVGAEIEGGGGCRRASKIERIVA